MSQLKMNHIRALRLTAVRELLPSGLVSFLPTSCWLEAQAPPSWLQPPGPGFWDSLGESKTLTLLYLPGVKNVLKSAPHRSWSVSSRYGGERWGVRFLRVQGLPTADVCAFPPASQLPTSSSQEVRIQVTRAEALLPFICNSQSHSEELGAHYLPFLSVLLLSR